MERNGDGGLCRAIRRGAEAREFIQRSAMGKGTGVRRGNQYEKERSGKTEGAEEKRVCRNWCSSMDDIKKKLREEREISSKKQTS